ncbi:hypothetical protein FRC14_001244 [Serendipita sp. 396]|nr:hypothetical protein FRC14_001244 [Serendipita sp. 396]KAG8785823.1 hypothetical protein FRC15_000643 [Serendipita sp. 397]KAG8801209.1 hypothetical protein FRC16_001045 [Serendipita sp. 398]KAG8828374.1 hypothetical protein FRC19_006472 [Serendipita sp. 401]KAG8834802.1 hypothetical protein FRC18_001476 [Serendipita sp. 400]KAG8859241.1 hypothetical protein FRB91_008608 [Serendipita sp. 411]KAG8869915.1 hypothetical protein FRC20_000653 [Serendipita sp. 405]KAG9058518.1 hypothetical prot
MPKLEKLAAGDCIVAVMGLTGSGKTSFIAKACSQDDIHINTSLRSESPNIQTFTARHPKTNQRVVFVDTPGFDDTSSSDVETLTQISSWFLDAHGSKASLSAILYLHPIDRNRVSGPARRNLEMFAALCGKDAMPNIVLVTTMWDLVTAEEGEARVEELKEHFWNEMLDNGGITQRFDGTSESVWKILSDLPNDGTDLQIRKEMSRRRKALHKTKAFWALNDGMSQWLVDVRDIVIRKIVTSVD